MDVNPYNPVESPRAYDMYESIREDDPPEVREAMLKDWNGQDFSGPIDDDGGKHVE